MTSSNVHVDTPIVESAPGFPTKQVHRNGPISKDDYTIRPLLQRNTQEDDRTLLNPVLTETKEEEEEEENVNDFSKFDEEAEEEEKLSDINEEEEPNLLLQKEPPVKNNSSSSLNTLENVNQNQIVSLDKDVDGNNNNNNNNDNNNNNNTTSPNGDSFHSPNGDSFHSPNGDSFHSPNEDSFHSPNEASPNGESPNGDDEEEYYSTNDGTDEEINMNNIDFSANPVKVVRRSFTENDINYNRNVNFNSSSNIRNIDGKDVVVDCKYRNINCIKEGDEPDGGDIHYKKQFRSINGLLGHQSINASMELFLSKHKNKQHSSSKFEVENNNFINVSRKKLDHVIFTTENCSEVRRIDASYNCIQELPQTIGIYDRLVELNVSNNKLKTIPTEIGFLKSLSILNLSDNEIESLPFQIGGLKSLKFLYVSDNKLQTFPREIGMLTNLEGLYASNNKIGKLPVEFIRLQKLKVLDFCNNSLFCFKFKLSYMKNLEKLYLSNNQFPQFPNELTQMDNLCELYMDNNKINTIPNEISQMKRLKILRLNNNKIQKIPETLCHHKKLRILRLQNNLIKSIPKKINHMKNLRELNIDHNMIVDVPNSIALLPRLRKITYEGNYFSPEEMEDRIFAIGTLETANNEVIQRYCYRPVKNSFVKKAIDNIQVQSEKALPLRAERKEREKEKEKKSELPEVVPAVEGPLDTIMEEMAPTIPAMVPESSTNNNNSNTTLTAPHEKPNQEDKANPQSIKTDSNEVVPTTTTPEKTESSIKQEAGSSKNLSTTDNEDATLGSGGDGQVIKSQESLKLKLIDVVMPEDLTSSQSNFIFTYEESLRGSQLNMDDVRRSQTNLPANDTKGSTDSLEKKIFKKKYEHVPSKLADQPLAADDSTVEDESEVKRDAKKDYVIETIPLKKGDDEDDEEEKQKNNKFSKLAMGSTELFEKRKSIK